MKKYFLFLICTILATAPILAAVSDLQNGYYRIVNHYTNRYIQVMDNKGELMVSSATADMNAIVLVKGLENVISDPATVLRLEKHGSQFDITAQSTGIYQMISTYVNIFDSRDPGYANSYWAYGQKGGMVMYLADGEANLNEPTSSLVTLSASGNVDRRNWDIHPIDSSADNYFGVAPRVQIGGKYYEPFFADFPFSAASAGVKVYYISKVDEKNGLAVYKEITGTVPASTPVFIECSSDQPASNKLNIGGSASSISDNVGKGVYFEFTEIKKHKNVTPYDKTAMRSLGVLSDGTLGLVTGNYTNVPRNTFYVPVSSSAPAQLKLVSEEEYAQSIDPVYPTGVTLSSTSLTITIGDSQTLTATVHPDDTTNKLVTWTSSNTSVATVDAQGRITAVGLGTATITATCQNVSAACQVTVQGIQPTAVTISAATLDLKVGQSQTLTATVAPENTTDKTVTWSTSNASVASVANGVVTAVAPGTATITARCGNVSATCQVTVTAIAVTSITLSQSQLELKAGESQTLTATVLPENATYKTVTWTSSNTAVAAVDASGRVTAVGVGSATITASSGDVTATCAVTVTPVAATGVTLSATSLSMVIGESQKLNATVAPANTTDKTVAWTSSDTSVATVDANGTVRAVAEGTAVITATCGTVSATCSVSVRSLEVKSVTLSATSLDLNVGDQAVLTATVLPTDALDPTVTWTSSNPAVATVSAYGVVKGISAGEAVITAKAGNVTATCAVTVTAVPATGLTLSDTSLSMVIGDTHKLNATVSPANATDKTVAWTSSDTSVATVDANGTVRAVSEGTAVITATCGTVSATCSVSVRSLEVKSVTLSATSLDLKVGDQRVLTATVLPTDALDPTVTWTSSNPAVATVSAYGVVKAISAGEAVITAKAGSVTATCAVRVTAVEASAVTLSASSVDLHIGETTTLTATVDPANTTDKTVTWTSSDPAVATVSANGQITALSLGQATITATCGSVSATCAVTVSAVEAASIRLDRTTLELVLGDAYTFTVTISPDNVTDPTVNWRSGNEAVVTVDAAGTITAVGVGTAMITATCGSVSARCFVTVKPVAATSVTLSASSLSMRIGDVQTITATVAPDNTTDPTVTWTSDNEAVVTVDASGTVTAVGVGVATITATCGQASSKCFVSVGAVEATGIILSETEKTVLVGEEFTLAAIILPENVTYPVLGWATSDATVATVDIDGHVTAVGVGTAVITASCGHVSATCQVEVFPVEVASITLSDTELTLHVGDKAALTATVAPDNATDKTVTWTSSDTSVATVDASGVITAVALGTATIEASSGDVKAACTVTVAPIAVTEVTLDANEINMHVGDTDRLTATVTPGNATYATVTWTSSDPAVVSVTDDGAIEALAIGEATVTATADGVSATCVVRVLPIEAETVVLDTYAMTIEADSVVTITAIVLPDTTTDKTVTWTSSDTSVATVDDHGTVTAIAPGTVEITAACGEASATCEITVVEKQNGIADVTIDADGAVDVYNVQGMLVKRGATDLSGLPRGIYVVRGQKYYVK